MHVKDIILLPYIKLSSFLRTIFRINKNKKSVKNQEKPNTHFQRLAMESRLKEMIVINLDMYFKENEKVLSGIVDAFNLKLEELIDKWDVTKKEITSEKEKLRRFSRKFEYIEGLAEEAKKNHLKDRRDIVAFIAEVKTTHHVPIRLASLEERITLLEAKSHGSGEKASGTTR